MPDRLIIFARYPESGRVKTRLIPVLGARGAADLQHEMTRGTLGMADQVEDRNGIEVEVHFCGADATAMGSLYGNHRSYRDQGDGDLGARMARATCNALRDGCRAVVIIGTDCPGLTRDHVTAAFGKLRTCDLVLGPATDGGYYLIGLTREHPPLFESISWGTADVLGATLRTADRLGLAVHLLPVLSDVDRPEDLKPPASRRE